MRRRRIWLIFGVLLAVVLVGLAIYLRKLAASETARLLPEAEAIVYVDFYPIRLASKVGTSTPSVNWEPEYQQFVNETGFQFERDLDELAIAVHRPEPSVVKSSSAPELTRRYSEIFKARFDATRLNHYLHKLASEVEKYHGSEIFVIPYEGHTVRVSILSMNLVAVSNTSDVENIYGMIDRHREIALPFGGPALLRDYYHSVPFGSTAFVIAKLSSPDGKEARLPMPGGIEFTLPRQTVTVASLRYLGSIQLKAEAFTANPADAEQLSGSLTTFLQLFRSVESDVQPKGPDKDVKAFFDSIKVQQKESRVVLTAELPQGFIRKALSDAPAAVQPEPAKQEKAPPAKTKKRK